MIASTKIGKGGDRKRSDSFDTEEWLGEVDKAIDGEYYHPGEEGLAMSLLNDVGEIVGDNVEEAKEATSAVGDAVDAVDTVGDVAASAMGSMLCEAAEEVVEEVMDAIPGYGLCVGTWRLAWGSVYAVTGAASVATGAAIGAVGTVAGVAASPWDEGQLLNYSIHVAGSTAGWGGSVMGQGTSGVVRGTCNVVGQVPGTQVVTMPLGYAAKIASNACKNARTS